MSKREAHRRLNSLYATKQDHEKKMAKAQRENDEGLEEFHRKEILEMDRQIAPLEEIVGAEGDECPGCRKWVIPLNNKCPHRNCETYMG